MTDFLPGETLNNYDFDDEKTEKLFGYNVPEKFFFREEQERNRRKLREVCNRQTPVLRDVYLPSSGESPSWWLLHIFTPMEYFRIGFKHQQGEWDLF